ncbi:MAG: hypothetical protein HIU93_02035, partial [Acidobacteria bacterium]|nr:hypothetical protein [Acidobacteriota bacterium]
WLALAHPSSASTELYGLNPIEMWLTNLIPCIMVFVAFIVNMLFIPSMTQAIFGGAAGLTSMAPGVVGSLGGMALMKGGGGG